MVVVLVSSSVLTVTVSMVDVLGERVLSESGPVAAVTSDEGGLVIFAFGICTVAEEVIVSAKAFAICAATSVQS